MVLQASLSVCEGFACARDVIVLTCFGLTPSKITRNSVCVRLVTFSFLLMFDYFFLIVFLKAFRSCVLLLFFLVFLFLCCGLLWLLLILCILCFCLCLCGFNRLQASLRGKSRKRYVLFLRFCFRFVFVLIL